MNIEEELGRLLHDDRLDVPVKPGATEAVVAGARRVRHRRTAVVGAFAAVVLVASGWGVSTLGGPTSLPSVDPAVSVSVTVTSVPSTTASPIPSVVVPPPHTVVETRTVTVTAGGTPRSTVGYGAVKFGMTEQEVTATGLVTRSGDGECAAYAWKSDPGTANAVLVARGKGVAWIKLPPGGTTSAGVGVGATVEQLTAKYPAGQQRPGFYEVPMTGDVGWKYVFVLDGDKVVGIQMQRLGADCWQQGGQR